MPVLEITVSQRFPVSEHKDIDPAGLFAQLMKIDPELVTIYTHIMPECFGNQYQAIGHLYLPDLWSEEKIVKMQTFATQVITEYWKVPPESQIIMVHKVQSGHVYDKGKLETW